MNKVIRTHQISEHSILGKPTEFSCLISVHDECVIQVSLYIFFDLTKLPDLNIDLNMLHKWIYTNRLTRLFNCLNLNSK